MGAKRLHRGIAAGEFGFGQRRVDFPVAELVEEDGRPPLPALQPRDQVVQRAAPGRDRAAAERAGGRGVLGHEGIG